MPAIVTNKFRIHNAKSFIEGFNEDKGFTTFANTSAGDTALESHMYLFIGKVNPWTDGGSDDTNPPNPTDSVANTEYQHWRDMIAAKKITDEWVSHVIVRHNWKSGNNYYAYTHTENDLYNQAFYVVTDEYNVYKCLSNNLSNGATTNKPTHLEGDVTYGDGYRWKFMYQINAADALKYVTPNYIPVKRVRYANNVIEDDGSLQYHTETEAIDGTIHVINKTASGDFYLFLDDNLADYEHTTTSVQLGAAADGVENDIYANASIFLADGDIANERAIIESYDAATKVATLVSPGFSQGPANGTNYLLGPTIEVEGDGDGCLARAVGTDADGVTSVQVVANGTGYSTATVNFRQHTYANAETSTGAAATAIIEPVGGHGYDPVEELGGYYVMINTRLEYDESENFTVNNDFRKIGLLVNPLYSNTTVIDTAHLVTDSLVDQAVTLTINTTSWNGNQFNEDDVITGSLSGMTGRVVDFMGGNTTLRLIDVVYGTNTTAGYDSLPGSFQVGETLTVTTPGAQSDGDAEALIDEDESVQAAVRGGDMKKFSGNILYVENRSPITRASDQIEDIKLVIEF